MFPPHLGDATNYYLPKIAEWVRAGQFTREMGAHPHVTFPAGFELVETWWVVFIHHDVLIEMAGVEFLLLGVTATAALARSLGLQERSAFVAAILYGLTPGLNLAATSCTNDLPAASIIVTAFAFVLGRLPLGWTIFALGVGIGIKPTVGYGMPGIVLLSWLLRKEEAPREYPRSCVSIAAAVGIVLGSFWYIRNMVWFGNPFYPVCSRDRALFPPPQFGPRAASLLGNVRDLVDSRIWDPHAYGALVDDSAGWGPVGIGCGLLALLLWALEAPPARAVAVSFLLSLCSILFLSIHDPWSMKYVFFFPAILSVAVAREMERSTAMVPLVVAGTLISFLTTMSPYDLPRVELARLEEQSWRERSVLDSHTLISLEPSVALFGGIQERAYLLYGPDFSRRVIYCRPKNLKELVVGMQKEGVSLLLAQPATEEQAHLLEEAIEQGELVVLNGSFYSLVHRATARP